MTLLLTRPVNSKYRHRLLTWSRQFVRLINKLQLKRIVNSPGLARHIGKINTLFGKYNFPATDTDSVILVINNATVLIRFAFYPVLSTRDWKIFKYVLSESIIHHKRRVDTITRLKRRFIHVQKVFLVRKKNVSVSWWACDSRSRTVYNNIYIYNIIYAAIILYEQDRQVAAAFTLWRTRLSF